MPRWQFVEKSGKALHDGSRTKNGTKNSRTKWGDINCFRPAKAAPVTVPVLWSGMKDAAPRPGHGSKLRVESSREDRHRPAVGVVGGIGHELVIGGQRDLLVERVCVIGLEDALAAIV